MATVYSTQATKINAGGKNSNYPARAQILPFDFVMDAVGATATTLVLATIPPGRWRLYLSASLIEWTVQATGGLMDIGYQAYTKPDGTAVVADTDAFDNDIATDAAGTLSASLGSDLAAKSGKMITLESRDGVVIVATLTVIAAAAEIHGFLTVSN